MNRLIFIVAVLLNGSLMNSTSLILRNRLTLALTASLISFFAFFHCFNETVFTFKIPIYDSVNQLYQRHKLA